MEQNEYTVDISGLPHTFLLTPEQAKGRGLSEANRVETKQAPEPKNKARGAQKKD